jgi:hypothetical protein
MMRGSRRLEASKHGCQERWSWATQSLRMATAFVIGRAVLVRHQSHEQQKDHCAVRHDAMFSLSVLMARSLIVIELAAAQVPDDVPTHGRLLSSTT